MARKQTSDKNIVVSTGAAAAQPRRRAGRRTAAVAQGEAPPLAGAAVAPEAQPEEVYQPSHDDIALLAYSYWEARGYQGGSPEDDWRRAEMEIRSRVAASVS